MKTCKRCSVAIETGKLCNSCTKIWLSSLDYKIKDISRTEKKLNKDVIMEEDKHETTK